MQFARRFRNSVLSFAPPAADRFRLGHHIRSVTDFLGCFYLFSPLSSGRKSTAFSECKPVSNWVRDVLERAMQRRADRLRSARARQEGKRLESIPSVRHSAPSGTSRYYRYECPAPWTPLHRSPSTSDFATPAFTPTSVQQSRKINLTGLLLGLLR